MNAIDKRHRLHDKDKSEERDGKVTKTDEPPNSRLFIVCGKQITEDEFRECFGEFGTIEEIWVLKDRATQEPKGIAYIKFSKTSEAALAMEEMNGRCIAGHPRPLKVLIAHSRVQGSRRDLNEEERLLRLFVVVPKNMNEPQLREHFSQFGDIDYVSIVKDRNTKESKGFGYIKYHRMSHAAKAFEGCDRNFKPVFADPKPQKGSSSSSVSCNEAPGSTGSSSMTSAYDMLAYMDTSSINPDNCCRLSAVMSQVVTPDHAFKLFDLIPGLDFCDRKSAATGRGSVAAKGTQIFSIVYNNPQSASYAKEKLHGFEYPLGQRMSVKYDSGRPMVAGALPQTGRQAANIDLAHLTETIANATALLQAAGYCSASPSNGSSPTGSTFAARGETYDPAYCSVKLPPPQPLAAMDSAVAERLFVVCTPVPPPLYALKDVFGRFGHLIDIYMLSGKTCGYAKYASKESADRAATALHGQEICGARLKVMAADPQDKSGDSTGRKRQKIDDV